jgi:nucleotide-binding universal stress UspA family protein
MAFPHAVSEGVPEGRRPHPRGPESWPFRTILAAVNPFTNSEVAARYAIPVARACGARLSFVFVAGTDEGRKDIGRAESALERLFLEARDEGLDAERVVETGDPVRKIVRIARERDIDLVFTATRREDVRERFFARTVSRDLMLGLPCAVAMVRVVRLGKVFSRTILVPLRGRMAHVEERAAFVAALARGFHSAVILFHIAKPITRFFHGEVHLTPVERERHLPREVEMFRDRLERHGVPHEKRTGLGAIARSITTFAAHRHNDLIVMDAGERTPAATLPGGDPVEDVLRETPCNLIVYRPSLWRR